MAGLVYAILYSIGAVGVFAQAINLKVIVNTLQSNEVLSAFLFSFYIAIMAIAISLLVVLPNVITFHQQVTQHKNAFVLYLPLAIPAIVAAFISFQLFGKTGLLSAIAFKLGIINNLQQFPDWVNDTWGIGIIATHALMAIPFFTIYFSNLFVAENLQSLGHVAHTLGATPRQVTYKIYYPNLIKKGAATILLYFVFVLGSYEIPLLLGQQQPQMITVLIVKKLQRFNIADMPQGYCIAVLYCILIMLVMGVFFKLKKQTS
ncbi:ABC transporter permease subunit [Ferruginibacter yonginensis]|uniref:ABC transporter permease subunit n=1 Tax=Ferruginibacter yonginensis TaxID=1310416 RepID=A0ABV8QU24_9BACT